MKRIIPACVGMVSIIACYGIYAFTNPGADGVVFATILAAVTALASGTVGYALAAVKR